MSWCAPNNDKIHIQEILLAFKTYSLSLLLKWIRDVNITITIFRTLISFFKSLDTKLKTVIKQQYSKENKFIFE